MIHDGVNVDINFSSPLSEIELHIPVTAADPNMVWEPHYTYSAYIVSVGSKKRSLDLETIYWLKFSITVRVN